MCVTAELWRWEERCFSQSTPPNVHQHVDHYHISHRNGKQLYLSSRLPKYVVMLSP